MFSCSKSKICLAVVIALTGVAIAYVVRNIAFKPLPHKGEGFAAPMWNRVAEVFKQQVESGRHKGGGFAVYHRGELVVEFVGGYADYDSEWQWQKDTLSYVFSATKGVAAVVVAILVDRGLLDYKAPVAKYWPEFAQNGKQSITVEQLLSHQAGLFILSESFSLFDMINKPDRLADQLAAAKPRWDPGSTHGYHAITMGLYMDQLVRRLDPHHRRMDEFFAEEVARKFGIDFYIGLPKEENYRCARFQGFSHFENLFKVQFWKLIIYFVTSSSKYSFATISENFAEGKRDLYNHPSFREIPCPSFLGFGTVASLAHFYGILANGGQQDDRMLLSQDLVEKLNEPLISGVDAVMLMNITYGRGSVIMKSVDGHNIFGHPGYGGQAAFADPSHRLGWSYVTNYPSIYINVDDDRYLELVQVMYETVLEIERRERPKK